MNQFQKDEFQHTNSFNDDIEQNQTPRGSIHTNVNFPSEDQSKSGLGFNNRQPNNKIRVIVRMRPFLENEHQELAKMSNVMAQGKLKMREEENEIHVFPNANQ